MKHYNKNNKIELMKKGYFWIYWRTTARMFEMIFERNKRTFFYLFLSKQLPINSHLHFIKIRRIIHVHIHSLSPSSLLRRYIILSFITLLSFFFLFRLVAFCIGFLFVQVMKKMKFTPIIILLEKKKKKRREEEWRVTFYKSMY